MYALSVHHLVIDAPTFPYNHSQLLPSEQDHLRVLAPLTLPITKPHPYIPTAPPLLITIRQSRFSTPLWLL